MFSSRHWNGSVPVDRSQGCGPDSPSVGGVSTVGHFGEGLGYLPQLLGHLSPLRLVEGGQVAEQELRLALDAPLRATVARDGCAISRIRLDRGRGTSI